MSDKKPFVTVTQGMSGHFAALMAWYNDIQSYDVFQTGVGRYRTRDEAVSEARAWADAENVELRV